MRKVTAAIVTFFKYFAVALMAQIGALFTCYLLIGIFRPLEFLLFAVITVYAPTIGLVSVAGNFKGEAAMISPFMLGIPAGVLLYSLVFARIMLQSSLRRSSSAKISAPSRAYGKLAR